MNFKAVIEGLLFVVGDEGLTINQISEVLELDKDKTKEILSELKKDYEKDNRGIRISYLGNSFKLTTKVEHKLFYQKLLESSRCNNLSDAALEILAIIVYNEPITRIRVDETRGINSGQMIRKLVAKGLLKEIGRADLPGRPILYKTTNEFLDYFGLASKDELPKLDKTSNRDENEVDLFISKYNEES